MFKQIGLLWIVAMVGSTGGQAAGPSTHFMLKEDAYFHTEIPLTKEYDKEYAKDEQPFTRDFLLPKGEKVQEMPKDKHGAYSHFACKREGKFGFQVNYDWSWVRSWACVDRISKPTAFTPPVSEDNSPLIFYTQDFPPYSFLEGQAAVGPGVALVKWGCQQAKLSNCKITLAQDQTEIEAAVNKGQAHGLFFVSKDENLPGFALSQPLIEGESGFFVHKDPQSPRFHNPKDLGGKKMGVYGPSATQTAAEQLITALGKAGIWLTLCPFSEKENAFICKLDNKSDTSQAFTTLCKPDNKPEDNCVDFVYSNKAVGERIADQFAAKYVGQHRGFGYHIALKEDYPPAQLFLQAIRHIQNEELKAILSNYEQEKLPLGQYREVGWVYRPMLNSDP